MELRRDFEGAEDLALIYVMADSQINEKTLRFIDELGLRERVIFAEDRGSAAIDSLGLRRPNPDPIEDGVPHPTTYLLDREGTVRFVDVREDFHIWIDSAVVRRAVDELP